MKNELPLARFLQLTATKYAKFTMSMLETFECRIAKNMDVPNGTALVPSRCRLRTIA